MLFFAWTVILLYSLGIKTSLAWASQIIVLGCKLKDLLVLIHCVRRRYFYLLLTKLFLSWCFHLLFTLLVRKNLYLIITSFSQYTTICFVSILYSVFNEHLLHLRAGGDDVDLRVPRVASNSQQLRCWRTLALCAAFLNWHHFRDRDGGPGRDLRPDGGDDGIRTHDPLLAGQVLSQLSYTPKLMVSSYLLFPFRKFW